MEISNAHQNCASVVPGCEAYATTSPNTEYLVQSWRSCKLAEQKNPEMRAFAVNLKTTTGIGCKFCNRSEFIQVFCSCEEKESARRGVNWRAGEESPCFWRALLDLRMGLTAGLTVAIQCEIHYSGSKVRVRKITFDARDRLPRPRTDKPRSHQSDRAARHFATGLEWSRRSGCYVPEHT